MADAPWQPRNLVAVLLSVVTGLGHFYLDRYLTGAVLFGLFVTSINGIFLGSTLQVTASPGLLKGASIVAFVVVWCFGLWHAYRLSYGTDRPALARAKDALLREGIVDYLRDDLEDALHKLERAVALDIDWLDPDPLFHLGVVALRLSERRAGRGDAAGAKASRRRAAEAFKGCLARDPRRKWRAEAQTELERLHAHTSLTGRLRKVGSTIKEVVTTASGMFRRPSPADLTPAAPIKVVDPSPVTQTRKKKRFSAKYEALPRPHDSAGGPPGVGDTRADLGTARWGGPTPAPAIGDTRPDLRRDEAARGSSERKESRFLRKLDAHGDPIPAVPPAAEEAQRPAGDAATTAADLPALDLAAPADPAPASSAGAPDAPEPPGALPVPENAALDRGADA